MTTPEQPAQSDLRQRIAQALRDEDARYWGHDVINRQTGRAYAFADAVLAVVQPLLDQRPGCPDPIECDHEAELGQLREQLADMVNLSQARVTLQMFRHAIGSSATQITDLIHGINRATGPMARAQREAAHYRARWESTVVEARRQAARADAAEQSKAEIITLCHAAIYHSGGPSCPAPNTCPTARAAAPSATT